MEASMSESYPPKSPDERKGEQPPRPPADEDEDDWTLVRQIAFNCEQVVQLRAAQSLLLADSLGLAFAVVFLVVALIVGLWQCWLAIFRGTGIFVLSPPLFLGALPAVLILIVFLIPHAASRLQQNLARRGELNTLLWQQREAISEAEDALDGDSGVEKSVKRKRLLPSGRPF